MPRIRTIKPDFWTSEQVTSVSRDARLLFVACWNYADDGGVLPAKVHKLRLDAFPDDGLNNEQVAAWIRELIDAKLLVEFEASDSRYGSRFERGSA